MKLIDSNGVEHIVHFEYSKWDGRRTTICRIHQVPCARLEDGPCTKSSVHGVAACSRKDEFTKSTGRKIALARAMEQLPINKDHRASLWTSYLAQVRPAIRIRG